MTITEQSKKLSLSTHLSNLIPSTAYVTRPIFVTPFASCNDQKPEYYMQRTPLMCLPVVQVRVDDVN